MCNTCSGMGHDSEDLPCPECKGHGRVYAFYTNINEPNIPSPEEVGDGIVRMNCGHDSNLEKELVLKTAERYKHVFFNTSIPDFRFPGPVVYTANRDETAKQHNIGCQGSTDNLMFVRLRTSSDNIGVVLLEVDAWTSLNIPVVLTFMAYYDEDKLPQQTNMYEWKKRHINEYWCPTRELKEMCLNRAKEVGGRLVTMCGTLDSNYCRDCRNCETYYWQARKRLNGN